MTRSTRLLVLGMLVAAASAAGPALAAVPGDVLPSATCSTSGVLANGKVHLSGGGFTPGAAYVTGSSGFGGTIEIAQNGGFQILNVPPGEYSIRQGGQFTECST